MIIKIAIADNHEEYVKRLVRGLEKKKELNLFVYDNKEALEMALHTKKFDILLFTQSMYDGRVLLPEFTLAVMLTDESEEIPEQYKEFYKIKKYQRISTIYSKILNAYADICENVVVGDTACAKKIIFYSPIGGSGKTTLALAAAEQLAMRGQRVLYLNFEDIPSDGCYLPQSKADEGISELLACLDKDTNLTIKLQGLVNSKKENFDYLNHFSSPNDLYEMTPDELEKMMKKISEAGLYDYLVIDTESALNNHKKMLFECADKIVVISTQGQMAVEKMQCFAKQLHILNEYGEKMVGIVNQAVQMHEIEDIGIPIADTVMKIQNLESDKLISMIAAKNMKNVIDILIQI